MIMKSVSFRYLIELEILPWRYRIGLAFDLGLILKLVQEEKFIRFEINHRTVEIDSQWRAYFHSNGKKRDILRDPVKEMREFGLILALLITGGRLTPENMQEPSNLKVTVSQNLRPGCSIELVDLCYRCLNPSEPRITPAQVVNELDALLDMHCPAGFSAYGSREAELAWDENQGYYWANNGDDLTIPDSLKTELQSHFRSCCPSLDAVHPAQAQTSLANGKNVSSDKTLPTPSTMDSLVYFVDCSTAPTTNDAQQSRAVVSDLTNSSDDLFDSSDSSTCSHGDLLPPAGDTRFKHDAISHATQLHIQVPAIADTDLIDRSSPGTSVASERSSANRPVVATPLRNLSPASLQHGHKHRGRDLQSGRMQACLPSPHPPRLQGRRKNASSARPEAEPATLEESALSTPPSIQPEDQKMPPSEQDDSNPSMAVDALIKAHSEFCALLDSLCTDEGKAEGFSPTEQLPLQFATQCLPCNDGLVSKDCAEMISNSGTADSGCDTLSTPCQVSLE